MPAILRLQEAATSHLGLRERVGNPIGGKAVGLATRSALRGSNRPLLRARTAAQETIVGRRCAGAERKTSEAIAKSLQTNRSSSSSSERDWSLFARPPRRLSPTPRIWHNTRSDLQGG